MHDLLIQNATVYDGSGGAPYTADVAVKDGKIVQIGQGLLGGKTVIDARGLCLSPGWIDSHSHSDRMIISHPDQKEKVEQGITFSVTGQCGSSPAPVRKNGELETMGDFLRKTTRIPQGSGTVLLIGHNTLRKAVVGSENRAPTAAELEQMKELLREGLKAGAIGMSLGLRYAPGSYAKTEEVLELARVVADQGGLLTTHLRDEADLLVEATEEFLSIVKATGCRGVISHHKAMNRPNWGKVKTTVAMIDRANAEGTDVYMDVYPYIASSSSLIAFCVPSRFHPPGTTDARKLLDDPDICAAIKQWGNAIWNNDLSHVLITSCPNMEEYEGMTIAQIAGLQGQSDQFETCFDVVRRSEGAARGCFFSACEEDLHFVMRHPRAMLCTDAMVAGDVTRYHPRVRAAFPRALGHYVRELGVLALPEMIRRMTGLPAEVYGLRDKGRVVVGADADICIFDADRIAGRADYVNCSLPNEGLCYVIIGGEIVAQDGVYNGIRAGKVSAHI